MKQEETVRDEREKSRYENPIKTIFLYGFLNLTFNLQGVLSHLFVDLFCLKDYSNPKQPYYEQIIL